MTSSNHYAAVAACPSSKVANKATNCLNLDDYVRLPHHQQSQQQQQEQPTAGARKKEAPSWPCRDFVYPRFDVSLFQNDRVLMGMLKSEEKSAFQVSCNYFKCVQTEVTEPMRRTVVEWMLEVSTTSVLDAACLDFGL